MRRLVTSIMTDTYRRFHSVDNSNVLFIFAICGCLLNFLRVWGNETSITSDSKIVGIVFQQHV